MSREHRDYILCKEVYHCSPAELESIPEYQANLHFEFLMLERKEKHRERKKAEQKNKVKNK